MATTLASVKNIADQIVVVDTGSTDRTPEIAGEFDATVLDFPWEDSFAAARNYAMSEIRADWVLWIDAGEKLSADDATSLRSIVDKAEDRNTCYALWIELPQATTDSYGERVTQVRLIPSSVALRFEGRVRESLLPSITTAKFQVERCDVHLHRSTRDHEQQRKQSLAARDLPLIEQEIIENGRLPKWLIAAGDVHVNLGDPVTAAACYREALKTAEQESTDRLAAYYGLLTCCGTAAAPEGPVEVCIEALEHFPFDAQLLCAMGNYVQAIGQTEMATRAFDLAMNYGEVNPMLWHVADVTEMAALCLSALLRNEKEYDRAQAALDESLAARPESIRLHRARLDLYVRQGRQHEALAAVDAMPGDIPRRDALRSAVRGACLVQDKNWIPAVAYLQSAYSAGCHDIVCLQWLSVALISSGCLDAAEPVVNAWLAIEPHNAEVRRYVELLNGRASDDGVVAAAGLGTSDAVTTFSITTAPDAAPPTSLLVTAAAEHLANDPSKAGEAAPANQLQKLRIDAVSQPQDGEVHFQLGSALVGQGQDDEAEKVWRSYLSHTPEDSKITTALSELLVTTRRVQEGLDLAAPLMRTSQVDPAYREFAAALEHFSHQRWDDALHHFQASRDAGYDHPRLLEYHARCLGNLQRYAEAEPMWRELLMREATNATAHDELAKLLAATGRAGEADRVRGQLTKLRSVPSAVDMPSSGFSGTSTATT